MTYEHAKPYLPVPVTFGLVLIFSLALSIMGCQDKAPGASGSQSISQTTSGLSTNQRQGASGESFQYDPNDPFQARLDQVTLTLGVIDDSVFAFYREYRRIPSSFEELKDSRWLWFTPASTDNLLNPNFVERDVAAGAQDADSIGLTFSQGGFTYSALMPTEKNDPSGYDIFRWPYPDKATSYNKLLDKFPVISNYNDNNPVNIRIDTMVFQCDRLAAMYWGTHGTLPSSASELLDSRLEVRRDVVKDFPKVNPGDEGWFCFSVSLEKGITCIRYAHAGEKPQATEKIFLKNDPSAEEGSLGRIICPAEWVDPSVTTPIIDASLPGWGFIN